MTEQVKPVSQSGDAKTTTPSATTVEVKPSGPRCWITYERAVDQDGEQYEIGRGKNKGSKIVCRATIHGWMMADLELCGFALLRPKDGGALRVLFPSNGNYRQLRGSWKSVAAIQDPELAAAPRVQQITTKAGVAAEEKLSAAIVHHYGSLLRDGKDPYAETEKYYFGV